jgi:hypothetical protein
MVVVDKRHAAHIDELILLGVVEHGREQLDVGAFERVVLSAGDQDVSAAQAMANREQIEGGGTA